MDLAIGVGAVSFIALVFAWGFQQHRRSPPARWTTGHWGSVFFSVFCTLSFAIGLGMVAKAFLNPASLLAPDMIWAGPVSLIAAATAIVVVRRVTAGHRLNRPVSPVRTPPAAAHNASNRSNKPGKKAA